MFPQITTGPVLTAVQANALRRQLDASIKREDALAALLSATEAERDGLREVAHEAATRLRHMTFTEIRDKDGRLTNAENLYDLLFRGTREISRNLTQFLRATRRTPEARTLANEMNDCGTVPRTPATRRDRGLTTSTT
jgi:hypothetical protein